MDSNGRGIVGVITLCWVWYQIYQAEWGKISDLNEGAPATEWRSDIFHHEAWYIWYHTKKESNNPFLPLQQINKIRKVTNANYLNLPWGLAAATRWVLATSGKTTLFTRLDIFTCCGFRCFFGTFAMFARSCCLLGRQVCKHANLGARKLPCDWSFCGRVISHSLLIFTIIVNGHVTM